MNLYSLRLGIKCTEAGMATRSYVIMYIITLRLSVRLCSRLRLLEF